MTEQPASENIPNSEELLDGIFKVKEQSVQPEIKHSKAGRSIRRHWRGKLRRLVEGSDNSDDVKLIMNELLDETWGVKDQPLRPEPTPEERAATAPKPVGTFDVSTFASQALSELKKIENEVRGGLDESASSIPSIGNPESMADLKERMNKQSNQLFADLANMRSEQVEVEAIHDQETGDLREEIVRLIQERDEERRHRQGDRERMIRREGEVDAYRWMVGEQLDRLMVKEND